MGELNERMMFKIISQSKEWIYSGEDQYDVEITIRLHKSGLPDDFSAECDKESLGKLMVALTTDEELQNVAYGAVLFLLSGLDESERERFIRKIRFLF